MLEQAGLELSLLFGRHIIFLLFYLIVGFDCFLVSSYVNLAQWSLETQHFVVRGWQRFHCVNLGSFQNGVE